MQPTIKRCIQIHGGALKPNVPWTLGDTETVDGMDFVHIRKSDNGFNRFVTGKKCGALRDAPFLDILKKQRNTAMVTFHEEVNAFGVVNLPPPWRARQMNFASRDKEKPKILELDLPEVVGEEETAAAITMKVKAPSSGIKADGVCVEVTVQNLHYIRIAMKASIGLKSGVRHCPTHPSSSGCQWVKRRKGATGYLATRYGADGKLVSKFFPSRNDDARTDADKWRAGEDAAEATAEEAAAEEVDAFLDGSGDEAS
jgi:hypothetical protein